MDSNKIFCISSGQIKSKKKNSVFAKKHRYLNYGLLKVASNLGASNYNPIVIHGLFNEPEHTLKVCGELGLFNTDVPILLSIPSFYALEWAKLFIQLVKKCSDKKPIIVGGRWVVGGNEEWIKGYLNADLVVPGLIQNEIIDIVNSVSKIYINKKVQDNYENVINYSYLHESYFFQPSIEVSHGCGMGCSFCEEKDLPLSKLKTPAIVAKEMELLIRNDGLIESTPYLESSMFVATEKWAEALCAERDKIGLSGKWRVETRVDKLKVRNIPLLAKTGLKVIDLGLESASNIQLERMNKTQNPKKYLQRAEELIQVAYENGIWVKINILLYAGETVKTIGKTISWVTNIRRYIKGVSVGPVIVYGFGGNVSTFIEEMGRFGASAKKSDVIGVTNINLSKDIDFKKSMQLSKEIAQEFMKARDFYDLKSFSYFSRDYRYTDFLEDLKKTSKEDVSFSI